MLVGSTGIVVSVKETSTEQVLTDCSPHFVSRICPGRGPGVQGLSVQL